MQIEMAQPVRIIFERLSAYPSTTVWLFYGDQPTVGEMCYGAVRGLMLGEMYFMGSMYDCDDPIVRD